MFGTNVVADLVSCAPILPKSTFGSTVMFVVSFISVSGAAASCGVFFSASFTTSKSPPLDVDISSF